MKHRIIALLIAAISGIIVASAYDIKVDGIYYNVIDGEYLEVTSAVQHDNYHIYPELTFAPSLRRSRDAEEPKVEYRYYSGDVVIPDSVAIEGYRTKIPVKRIGRYAFLYEKQLVSVTLSSSIQEIGEGAFAFSSIQKLDMGNAVLPYIGDWMCICCIELSEIIFPKNLEKIGKGAFMNLGENFRSLTIPATVHTIGRQAFCLSCFDEIKGLETVTSYGPYCFFNLAFQTVKIHSTLRELSARAFCNIGYLKEVYSFKSDPEDFDTAETMLSVFEYSNPDCTLWVPDESLELYKNSERWTSFFTDIRPLSQSGIREVTTTTGICEPARYFDLSGREVTVPQSGHIYIGSDGQKIRF